MKTRSAVLFLMFCSSVVTPAVRAAESPMVPPPVVYGPPDDYATPVPPPSSTYMPADPAARRDLVLSSALLQRAVVKPKKTEEQEAGSAGGTEVPRRISGFETEAVIVDPVTTVASDAIGVEEPVIINLIKYGLNHTLTAFIRRIGTSTVRNEWSYRASNGAVSGGSVPLPTGYTDSADPVLAHNGTTGGIAPLLTYMTGLTLNRAGFAPANPTSIRVWQSVNGGSSWTGTGSEVDVIASGTTRALDKPWIAVSETGSTTGYVYVSWVRLDTSGALQHELMFRRSRNGVSKPHAVCCYPPTWDAAVRVTELGAVQGPQIVVDSAGYVYIAFVDTALRQMKITRSRFPGSNFPSDGSSVFLPAQTISTYNRVNAVPLANTIFSGQTRVVPLPAARYNAAANDILVAWTEGETDQASTVDVRLFRVAATATMSSTSVALSSAVISAGVNQFTPVIETDGAGTVMMAYYDSRGLSGSNYQARVVKLSSTGAVQTPVFPDTNPTVLGSSCAADFVGEYQGLWRGEYPPNGFRYDVAWTCGPTSNRTIVRVGVQ